MRLCFLIAFLFYVNNIKYAKNTIFDHALSNLSEYDFFEKPLKNHIPKKDVIPYEIASPLFSDYAEKMRFIRVPDGSKILLDDENNFIYPENTYLIKTFYYYSDIRDQHSKKHIIETRILKNTSEGWLSFPYVWNENQTDAKLNLAGARISASWTHFDGNPIEILYSVPNMNQCKNCHTLNNVQKPIGPKIRNLNHNFSYQDGIQNQLKKWISIEFLESISDFDSMPKSVNYNNPKDFTVNQRARAWLDINCAHCHGRGRPAESSGLFLEYEEKNQTAIGIFKTPVAAGRGSGGRKYNIVPGHPEKSIIELRINSVDPGIMMPELSRKLIHKEGVELIQTWIREMDLLE